MNILIIFNELEYVRLAN